MAYGVLKIKPWDFWNYTFRELQLAFRGIAFQEQSDYRKTVYQSYDTAAFTRCQKLPPRSHLFIETWKKSEVKEQQAIAKEALALVRRRQKRKKLLEENGI